MMISSITDSIMYSFLIFLIAFMIFLFEIIAYFFFDKVLTTDIFILAAIMILPGVLALIRHDVQTYRESSLGRLKSLVSRRKRLQFFLERSVIYSVIGVTGSILYLGLSVIMPLDTGVHISLWMSIFFLIFGTALDIWRETLTQS